MPCNRYRAGCDYDIALDCRLCWKFAHDREYNLHWGGDGNVSYLKVENPEDRSFPCLHRGKQTREVLCRLCGDTERVEPVYRCGVAAPECSQRRWRSGGLAEVACCETCPQYTQAEKLDFGPGWRVATPDIYGAFNPSLIRHKGQALFAFRAGWSGAKICVGPMTPDYWGVWNPTRLEFPRDAICGREDPRLFHFQGKLHLSYVAVHRAGGPHRTSVAFAELSDDFQVVRHWIPNYPHRTSWEKNWQPFEHEGRLYAIYTVHPYRILDVTGEEAFEVHVSDRKLPWRCGEIRGGAAPMLHDGRWWSFFHGMRRVGCKYYTTGCFTFEPTPPFRITAITPQSIIDPEPGEHKVVFPCGAMRDGYSWLLSFGWNDSQSRITRINDGDIIRAMYRL